MGADYLRGIESRNGSVRRVHYLAGNRNGMIEHPSGNRVEMIMSRARVIWISLIPTLLLAGSVNCYGSRIACCSYKSCASLLRPEKHSKPDKPPPDNSLVQVVQRGNRRLNVQPGADRFASPATFAQAQIARSGPTSCPVKLPSLSPELAQCWQFHWRTALEPRAPSLVS